MEIRTASAGDFADRWRRVQLQRQLGEFYSGVMSCPDRAPAPLKLWLK